MALNLLFNILGLASLIICFFGIHFFLSKKKVSDTNFLYSNSLFLMFTLLFFSSQVFRYFPNFDLNIRLIFFSLSTAFIFKYKNDFSTLLKKDLNLIFLKKEYLFFIPISYALIRALIMPPMGWDILTYRGLKAAYLSNSIIPQTVIHDGTWSYAKFYPDFFESILSSLFALQGGEGLQWIIDVSILTCLFIYFSKYLNNRYNFLNLALFFTSPLIIFQFGATHSDLLILFLSFVIFVNLTNILKGETNSKFSYLISSSSSIFLAFCRPNHGVFIPLTLFVFLYKKEYKFIFWSVIIFFLTFTPWLYINYETISYPFGTLNLSIFGITLGKTIPLQDEITDKMFLNNHPDILKRLGSLLHSIFYNPLEFNHFENDTIFGPAILYFSYKFLKSFKKEKTYIFALFFFILSLVQFYNPSLDKIFNYVHTHTRYFASFLIIPLLYHLDNNSNNKGTYLQIIIYAYNIICLVLISISFAGPEKFTLMITLFLIIILYSTHKFLTPKIYPLLIVLPLIFLITQQYRHIFYKTFTFGRYKRYWIDIQKNLPETPTSIFLTSQMPIYQSEFIYPFLGKKHQHKVEYKINAINNIDYIKNEFQYLVILEPYKFVEFKKLRIKDWTNPIYNNGVFGLYKIKH